MRFQLRPAELAISPTRRRLWSKRLAAPENMKPARRAKRLYTAPSTMPTPARALLPRVCARSTPIRRPTSRNNIIARNKPMANAMLSTTKFAFSTETSPCRVLHWRRGASRSQAQLNS